MKARFFFARSEACPQCLVCVNLLTGVLAKLNPQGGTKVCHRVPQAVVLGQPVVRDGAP